jgi:D-beta-D-heptose 7-phosphate kinase/D-beta-D-heptose 1-phosphate adenosyltransferase
VVHVQRESTTLGGAGNVVRNLVAMGATCRFCGVVGEDEAGSRIAELLRELGVADDGLVAVSDRPTTRKTRVEARSQQMLRFDRETDTPIAPAAARALLRALERALDQVDGVILEDYGKGVLPPRILRSAIRRIRDRKLFVAVDPKESVTPYRGASLFKPNQRELEQLTGIRIREDADLDRAVGRLQRALPGTEFVVTRGSQGMRIFEPGSPPRDVPIAHSEVFDVQGAGDTSIAALALARLAGGSLLESVVIANAAAGVVVGKLGTATATPEEIRELLPPAVAAARGVGRRR